MKSLIYFSLVVLTVQLTVQSVASNPVQAFTLSQGACESATLVPSGSPNQLPYITWSTPTWSGGAGPACTFSSGWMGFVVPPSSSVDPASIHTFTSLAAMIAASNNPGNSWEWPWQGKRGTLQFQVCCKCAVAASAGSHGISTPARKSVKKRPGVSSLEVLNGEDTVVACGGVEIPQS